MKNSFVECFGNQLKMPLIFWNRRLGLIRFEHGNHSKRYFLFWNNHSSYFYFFKIIFSFQLIDILNKLSLKRSSLRLSIPNISTFLGDLCAKAIPIPGQEMQSYNEVVNVQKMSKVAFVLPTKTRPKKIAFTGSDGKT